MPGGPRSVRPGGPAIFDMLPSASTESVKAFLWRCSFPKRHLVPLVSKRSFPHSVKSATKRSLALPGSFPAQGSARSGFSRLQGSLRSSSSPPICAAKPLRLKILPISPWGSRFCRPFPVFSRFYEHTGGRGDPQIRSPTRYEALSTDIHRTAQQTTLRRWHLTPHDPSRAERTLHQL